MNRSKRVIAALAAAFVATLAGLAIASAPAAATERQLCITTQHGDLVGVVASATAKATLLPNGVKVETPDTPAEVHWQRVLVTPVKMSDVASMSYETQKLDIAGPNVNDAALPAYRIKLDLDGSATTTNDTATLVYEPYYQITGNPARNVVKTWDVLAGKFWSNELNIAPHGGSYADNKTWAQIITMKPNAKVAAFGWGQGTYNVGTVSRIDDVRFAGTGVCERHLWSTRFPHPSASASASASPLPSKSGGTVPIGTTPTSSSTDVAGLPVTGSNIKPLIAGGVGLLVVGATAIWLVTARRRRIRFES